MKHNIAQRLYIALGVDPLIVETGHKTAKQGSFTKAGPGRFARQGAGRFYPGGPKHPAKEV